MFSAAPSEHAVTATAAHLALQVLSLDLPQFWPIKLRVNPKCDIFQTCFQ